MINATVSSMEYNPDDRKLYMWDQRSALLYDIEFMQKPTDDKTVSTDKPDQPSVSTPSFESTTTTRPIFYTGWLLFLMSVICYSSIDGITGSSLSFKEGLFKIGNLRYLGIQCCVMSSFLHYIYIYT